MNAICATSKNPGKAMEVLEEFNAYYRDAKQVGAWEATRKMNEAGAQTIINEVNRQLQEWRARNPR